MSMEPFAWTRARGLALPRDALAAGPLNLDQFPAFPPTSWKRAVNGREVKEVALRQVDGQPFYEARLPWGPTNGVTGTGHEITGSASPAAGFDRLLIAADTLEVRKEPFDADTLVSRLAEAAGVPVVDTERLDAYDSYYYSRPEGALPLPVLRVRFADPLDTWVYIDPAAGQIVRSLHRHSRAERWLFNGLHSLDFAFWYGRRPLWDIGVILLSLGGLASSGIGLWIGAGRVRRAVARWRRRDLTRQTTHQQTSALNDRTGLRGAGNRDQPVAVHASDRGVDAIHLGDAFGRQRRLRRAVGDDAAGRHPDEAVGELRRQPDVVRDD